MDSRTRDNDPRYNMIHNDFLEQDQSTNHTMTCNPTITLSNNDTYTSQKCLSKSRQIESFKIMTLLQFYTDDFYNTDIWHDLILHLTLLLWTLAAIEVLLWLLQVMVLWNCIVLPVCVWVVQLCPHSCTCKTQTNIQTKYLHCPANICNRSIQNSNVNTFNIYEKNPIKHT